MNRFRSLFLLAAMLLLPATASAAGWTQAPGGHYAKLWGHFLAGNAGFGLAGEEIPTESFRMLDMQFYAEYGAAEDFTLIAKMVPIGSATYGGRTTAYAGPFHVGARRRFFDKKLQMSLEGHIGGSPGFGDSNLATDADPFVFQPVVRTGQTGWQLQFGYPLSFGWLALWAGPQVNTNPDLSHAFDAGFQFGAQLSSFVIDFHTVWHWTFDPPEVVNVTGAGDTRYIGVGISVSWWPHERFGINAGADGAALARSNAAALPFNLGVETKN